MDTYVQSNKLLHIQHNDNRSLYVDNKASVLSPPDNNLHGPIQDEPGLSLIRRHKRNHSNDGIRHVGNIFPCSLDPSIPTRTHNAIHGCHHNPTLRTPPNQGYSMMQSKAPVVNKKLKRPTCSKNNHRTITDSWVFSQSDASDDDFINSSSVTKHDKIETVAPVLLQKCSLERKTNIVGFRDELIQKVNTDHFLHCNISDTTNTNQRELQRPQTAPNARHSSPSKKFSSRSTHHNDKCHRVKKIKQYRFKSLRSLHDERK